MTGYYNNDYSWNNYIFISTPEDLKKELKLEDIGKELFFLKQQAFCETCDKTLKAFGSADKARALVQKHLGFKKYAGHKAFVKEIDFGVTNNCTTADIVGTKANTDRNDALRGTFYSGIKSKIEQEIASHETTIVKVQKAFKLTERDDYIPKCPKELQDGHIDLRSDNGRTIATIKADDFGSIEQLFAGTWGRDRKYDKDCYESAGMIAHYINLDGHYSTDKVYQWEYPTIYDDFVGFDQELEEPCPFCNEKIANWNDVYESSSKYVHRDCYKHFKEQESLQRYAERYAENLEKEAQKAIRDAEWEARKKELKAQEVSTS